MYLATLCLDLLLLFPPLAEGLLAPPAQLETQSRLRVLVGKSLIINSPQPLRRVSLTDPQVASALIISERQVLIHGLAPGSVSLLLWDEQNQAQSFDLTVEFDLIGLRNLMQQVVPDEESIRVRQLGAALILSGTVGSEVSKEKIGALAQTQSKEVVNLLTAEESTEVILLQVRFAEVNRSALRELGINIFSTGGANTIGAVSTQQFGQLLGNVGAVPAGSNRGSDPATPNLAGGGIGRVLQGTPAVFGLSDLLNLFVFRADINLGLTLRALEQRNLLQILAEPNLMALNGKEASFLAGGEFPFPIVQGGTGFNAVTIVFKEFGVRLKFTPRLLGDGRIRLKVAPEVSALDFANALIVSGFTIPAISTRRAETEVELRDGQSFAIAGLIDDRLVETVSKVPLLGDLPLLGRLFRSRAVNRTSSELLVMVTPRLVRPLDPDQLPEGPAFPGPFLDKEKFDEKGKFDRKGKNK